VTKPKKILQRVFCVGDALMRDRSFDWMLARIWTKSPLRTWHCIDCFSIECHNTIILDIQPSIKNIVLVLAADQEIYPISVMYGWSLLGMDLAR
jgi:hypothetical protein